MEGADLFDLVAEELDPQRLAAGRREHVDEAATNGKLAALLDPLHPRIAGEREGLGERVDSRLVAVRDDSPARGRPSGGRSAPQSRRPMRRRSRRCEHLERSGALADEMGRRLEPGVPADAARGEEPNSLLADEPGNRLGGIASVCILGDRSTTSPRWISSWSAASSSGSAASETQRDVGGQRRRRQPLVGAQALDSG